MSYRSNLETDPRHTLGIRHREFPNFYNKEQFKTDVSNGVTEYKIKVFTGSTWDWTAVDLRKTDLAYLEKHIYSHPDLQKQLSPKLIKKGKSFYLQFSFQLDTKLSDAIPVDQRITAVDLGLNSSAVCAAMCSDGTVYDRYFSNQSKDKDRLGHLLNRLRKKQAQGGAYARNKKLWTQINNINRQTAEATAKDIVDFALRNKSDVIVLEHLSDMRPRGSRRQRLHLWKKKYILRIVTSQAHKHGIRIRTVNPAYTSKLAYDGSGEVVRSKENYALCEFKNGKVYNADLGLLSA